MKKRLLSLLLLLLVFWTGGVHLHAGDLQHSDQHCLVCQGGVVATDVVLPTVTSVPLRCDDSIVDDIYFSHDISLLQNGTRAPPIA